MTEHQARIEELIAAPPTVTWSWRQRLVVLVIWVLAMVGIVGMAVAIVQVGNVAKCINTNLGQRSAPAASDAQAHIAFADMIRVAVTKMPPSAAERAAINAAFHIRLTPGVRPTPSQVLAGINDYATALAANQATRDEHPLGRC